MSLAEVIVVWRAEFLWNRARNDAIIEFSTWTNMSTKVDLYDSAYANYVSEVYRRLRMETYSQDLGHTRSCGPGSKDFSKS